MFARTPRLLLRPGWPEDAPALSAAIGDHPLGDSPLGSPWPRTPADAGTFLGRESDPRFPNVLVLRRTLGTPRLVGGVALVPPSGRDEIPELGFWIERSCWGLGFATEAARAVLDFARHALGLREIRATSFASNAASHNVLEKLGFRQVGEVLKPCATRGTLFPARRFSLHGEARRESDPAPLAA